MIEIKPSADARSFYVKVNSITRDTQRGIRQAYYKVGKDLLAWTKKSMKEPKSGKTYNVVKMRVLKVGPGRKQVAHIASAPGETPAILTRKLILSLNYLVRGWTELEYGADTPYAKALEEGAPKRNLEPRPYLKPAIEKNEGKAIEHFHTEIKKALKI